MKKLFYLILLNLLLLPGFSAFSQDRVYRTGLVPEEIDSSKIRVYQKPESSSKELFSYEPAAELPSSFDLSDQMPPVGDQGQQGSCAAWAVAYACKSYQEGVEEGWDLSSKSHQFSPAWIYNQLNNGADNGISLPSALSLVVSSGCDTLNNFPYKYSDYKTQPDVESYKRAYNFRATDYYMLVKDEDIIENLKTILAVEKKPILCALSIYQDFYSLNKTTNIVYDEITGVRKGGHAVCIVGYDDNLQAIKIINSWGTDWGSNGYGYISYNLIENQSVGSFVVLEDGENNLEPKFWASSQTIYYKDNVQFSYIGDLSSSDTVYLDYTTDNPKISGSAEFTATTKGQKSLYLTIPENISELRFTVRDSLGNTDNNNGTPIIIDVVDTGYFILKTYCPESNKPISNVTAKIYDQDGNIIKQTSTSSDGKLFAAALPNGNYSAVLTYDGNYKFENGEQEYTFDFVINDNIYSIEVPMLFKYGTAYIAFRDDMNSYTDALNGEILKIYKDNIFLKDVIIDNSSSQTILTELESGSYKCEVDTTVGGFDLKGSVEFEINALNTYASTPLQLDGHLGKADMCFTINGESTLTNELRTFSLKIEKDGQVYKSVTTYNASKDGAYVSYGSVSDLPIGEYRAYIDTVKDDYKYTGEYNFEVTTDNTIFELTMDVTKESTAKVSVYDMVYFRGTPNEWETTEMELVDDYTWQTIVTFASGDNDGSPRFKFDIYADWSLNYGDNDNDLYCDQNGADIQVLSEKKYEIIFNDQNLTYTVTEIKLNGTATITFTIDGNADCPEIVDLPMALKKDGIEISQPVISTDQGGAPYIYITELDAGSYIFSLDKVSNGYSYTGSLSFDITESSVNAEGVMTVTKSEFTDFDSTYETAYIRGTPNEWQTTEMTLIDHNTWCAEVTFAEGDSNGGPRFKFDIYADWSLNFGDNNNDFYCDQNGSDIYVNSNTTYKIYFNDSTNEYWHVAQ